MGCDCNIYLPLNVRPKDIVNVIGILCGKEKKWEYSAFKTAKWIKVEGIKWVGNEAIPEMTSLIVASPLSEVVTPYRESINAYHFWMCEEDRRGKFQQISVRSCNFWNVVGIKLVNFFGGEIDFNDCDEVEVNYSRRAKPNDVNGYESEEDFNKFQNRLFKLQPLTADDFTKFNNKRNTQHENA